MKLFRWKNIKAFYQFSRMKFYFHPFFVYLKCIIQENSIVDKTESLLLLSRRHPHSSPDIREQLLKSYLDTFTDPTSKQMAQLHGALCGITQLGVTVSGNLIFVFHEYSDECLTHKKTIVSRDSRNVTFFYQAAGKLQQTHVTHFNIL